LEEEQYCLVVNASNIQKDWDWISSKNDMKAELKNISDNMSLFAVQGPKAVELIQSLTDSDVASMKYYTSKYIAMKGSNQVLISATGYTGAGGFEIYVPNSAAQPVWDAIMEAGRSYGLQPIGLAARDTLRLEMGFCLYGNDIDDSTSPIEAGLGWITKFSKDFIDKDVLAAQKEEGTERRLIGFVMEERGIPRKDYPLLSLDGERIGHVTSGTMSPMLKKGIGMGYVRSEFKSPETEIAVEIRGKQVRAKVVRPPFISK
jgi:aminomethyltransferase